MVMSSDGDEFFWMRVRDQGSFGRAVGVWGPGGVVVGVEFGALVAARVGG